VDLSSLGLGARYLLVLVFVAAAIAKAVNPGSTRASMTGFRFPPAVARVGMVGLPVLELGIGVLLVTDIYRWGAAGALVLLAAFTALIGVTLAAGRRPACGCFGSLSSSPAGAKDIVRNAVLGLVAVVALVTDSGARGASVARWLTARGGYFWLTAALLLVAFGGIGVLTSAVVQLLRQQGRLLLRIEHLEGHLGEVGADPAPPVSSLSLWTPRPAPGIALPDRYGRVLFLSELVGPLLPTLLLFTDPVCPACETVIAELHRIAGELARTTNLVMILQRSATAEAAIPPLDATVVFDADGSTAASFGVEGVPTAVLITPDGMISQPPCPGHLPIRQLLASLTTPAAPAAPAAPASPAERITRPKRETEPT
jgi:hypothetical protein